MEKRESVGIHDAEPGEAREARDRGPKKHPRNVTSLDPSLGTRRKATGPGVPSRGQLGAAEVEMK